MVRSSPTYDVFVCGGGPAGLAAAIALRQRGLSVALADCFRPPIDKACGEGLMPDSVEALRGLGVSLNGEDTGSFHGIRFIGADGRVTGEFPEGAGIGIRRTVLHQALVDRAQDLGVETFWGSRVGAISRTAVVVDGHELPCRWIVGADGYNSQVRQWAGLQQGRERLRRIGMRRHYRIRPWSDFVEIYWGERSQMYVTPIAPDQVCVASISRARYQSFETALDDFPVLRERLALAGAVTPARGSLTVTRRLRRVTKGNVALIGEASGSCDAITGEGLAMGFRQAIALAEAISSGDLAAYEQAHRRIAALPHTMARAMLLMDASGWVRSRALRAFDAKPYLFQRLLSLHVGGLSPSAFGLTGALSMGWQLLTA